MIETTTSMNVEMATLLEMLVLWLDLMESIAILNQTMTNIP